MVPSNFIEGNKKYTLPLKKVSLPEMKDHREKGLCYFRDEKGLYIMEGREFSYSEIKEMRSVVEKLRWNC